MFSHLYIDSHLFQSPVRDSVQESFWPEGNTKGGVAHPSNQDFELNKEYLFVVARGAGMPPYGLEACRLGIHTLVQGFCYQKPPSDVQARLQTSFQAANKAVYDYTTLRVPERILGNSMIAAVLREDELTVASVGLGSVYLVRETLTEKLLPLRWRSPPGADGISHNVTSLLGSHVPLLVGTDCIPPLQARPYLEFAHNKKLKPGDVFILISDGFGGFMTEEEMFDVVTHGSETNIAQRVAWAIGSSFQISLNVAVTAVRLT